MYLSLYATAVALITGTAVQAIATPKVNEYKSADCSGPVSVAHQSSSLGDVPIDDTTRSLSLAGAAWTAYSGKSSDGGSCNGRKLVTLPQASCHRVDGIFPGEHVRCLRKK